MLKLNFFIIIVFIICQKTVVKCLYPFGLANGDTQFLPKVDDGYRVISLPPDGFKFYGTTYTPSNPLYLNTNGLFVSDQGLNFKALSFPLSNITMIAPFWIDISIKAGGDIYYREVNQLSVIDQIVNNIKQGFPSAQNFVPVWTFMATWDQVSFFGSTNTNIYNTFQAVLTTDGMNAFTVFQYETIMFTRTLFSPISTAGFNAGDGIRSYSLPHSGTRNITLLNSESNINTPGVWVFQVDSNVIVPQGPTSIASNPDTIFFTTPHEENKDNSLIMAFQEIVNAVHFMSDFSEDSIFRL
jgi:hypothetical protein